MLYGRRELNNVRPIDAFFQCNQPGFRMKQVWLTVEQPPQFFGGNHRVNDRFLRHKQKIVQKLAAGIPANVCFVLLNVKNY